MGSLLELCVPPRNKKTCLCKLSSLLAAVLMMTRVSVLSAQNLLEKHAIVDYLSAPERITIQGRLVVPVDADFIELITVR